MNKNSLVKELKSFKYYLKTLHQSEESLTEKEKKIAAHTLVGFIVNLNNLVTTGIYGNNTPNTQEIFSLIKEARDTIIHYGYFNDFDHVYNVSEEINKYVEFIDNNNFAKSISNHKIKISGTFFQISGNGKSKIRESSSMSGFLVFENPVNEESVYISKNDLVIINNCTNDNKSYLLKVDDEKKFYYKFKDNETVKVSFTQLLENSFFSTFKILKEDVTLDSSINKFLKLIHESPYKYHVASYRYGDKNYYFSIHQILRDFIYDNVLEEKLLNNNYSIKESSKILPIIYKQLDKQTIKNMVSSTSLNDLFFIDLYLKKYADYIQITSEFLDKISLHTNQSLILDLYEIGLNSLSFSFINLDRTKNFQDYYYQMKHYRNLLAHSPIDPKERELLINSMLDGLSYLNNLYLQIQQLCLKKRLDNPTYMFSKIKVINESSYVTFDKPQSYYLIKHLHSYKIINGKKYLKIDTNKKLKNCYLEVNQSLIYALNYNTKISNECLCPINNCRFIAIDTDTEVISKLDYTPEKVIQLNSSIHLLNAALEHLKLHPQYPRLLENDCFSAITFYDKSQTPTYTEDLRNLLYRGFCQKMLPYQLINTLNLVIDKSPDKPLILIDNDNNLVAKVFLAHQIEKENKITLKQLSANKDENPVEYGKLLIKDLKTHDIVTNRKR